ncbi:hypothetical protein [Bradyrhizobium betae]|uniref:Uncharacterized protein n=1 Tax=Bradyrhizobium betae TaxID=244734 RepID=A0A4Q1UP63_9BRAD|nr:hypothetical protein [Bradyrhizobium betae]RXT35367.1 hypothetical protein B5V03_36475 [Bradyrhizobium betae]
MTIDQRTNVRIWKTIVLCAVCLIVGCLAFDRAEACAVAGSQRGVLFDHIPEEVDAPVIVEVTIVGREADISSPDRTPLALMNARVERVVKGTLDSDALKVVTYLGTCTRIGAGHGFVAGTLDHDARLGLKLIAIQRSYEMLIRGR